MSDQIWQVRRGEGPLVATAIHAGCEIREDIIPHVALSKLDRLREEDPFTDIWTEVAPTQVVGVRSRFEVDLNRPRDKAVYRTPDDAWGLQVWKDDPHPELFDLSLAQYDHFYSSMRELFTEISDECGHFIVYDLHTYNHRRQGPSGPAAEPETNPQVNIGTGTLDRQRWAPVVDAFIDALRSFDFPGQKLDVRENVKFQGGNWPRWIHENFPDSGVTIAIEFRKCFMDEWTGEPDESRVGAISDALRSTIPGVLSAVRQCGQTRAR